MLINLMIWRKIHTMILTPINPSTFLFEILVPNVRVNSWDPQPKWSTVLPLESLMKRALPKNRKEILKGSIRTRTLRPVISLMLILKTGTRLIPTMKWTFYQIKSSIYSILTSILIEVTYFNHESLGLKVYKVSDLKQNIQMF